MKKYNMYHSQNTESEGLDFVIELPLLRPNENIN